MKNKIGWCSETWNPVWGCLNHCPYCYARKIANFRYKQMVEIEFCHHWKKHPTWAWTGDYLSGLKDFKLTFLRAQFDKKFPQKTQKIFVGSMSEIYYWEASWMNTVLKKIEGYPQHTFQFLTKFPDIYSKYKFPKNCWLGVTITRNPRDGESGRWDYYQFKQDNPDNLKFYCFEPLLMDMELQYYLNLEDIVWVIIGAETGTRKGKIIPSREWIENIIYYCRINKIPVYLKDSLKEIYPVERKEFPKNRTINKL